MSTAQPAARISRVMYELVPRIITVSSVEQLTPRMRRVAFVGDDLATFTTKSPEDHVKLVFPLEDGSLPVFPPREGQPRPVTRDYTPRRFDPEGRTLTIDFVVHGTGVASDWARRAEPGMRLGLAGPRGSIIVADDFDWYLAVGDETALPSIARRLEEAPAGQKIVAVIEVEDTDEEQEIATAADATVVWVHRNGVPAGTTSFLMDTVRELALPEGEGFTWVEGEATTVRDIRRYLLNERGFDRGLSRFSGHWKRGVANHDHHAPLDEDDE